MTLPATPESVRTARRFVAERVRRCPVAVASDCLLLTSELATNCVVHARTDYVVRVEVEDGRVRVEVADDEPDPPRLRERGNGLRMVEDLAASWGTEPCVDGPGKIVWFELRGDAEERS
jgi:anti-sigma regulatory factor (Ser/Thr protein kinase)